MPDELLDRLKAIRPDVTNGPLEPDPSLLEEILMHKSERTRVITPMRLASVAAIAATLVAALLVIPGGDDAKAPTRQTPSLNMRTIVESTKSALSSGRAHITYTTDNGHFIHDSGNFTIEFSGENRSTVGTLDPGNPCEDASVSVPQERCESPAFEIANKVVDGRFYLRDGAPGHQTWIEDTNEHLSGSDLFNADPRTLVAGADDGARFRDVGAAEVDGVAVRHLKATRLDAVPRVNLGLGPVNDDGTKVTKFDVWVDAGNVVRRLDVSTSFTQTVYPLARTTLEKDANGKVIGKSLDESNMGPSEERTQVTDYSVRFRDIGADIVITAPANARKVAGQG
jgi:hypothetical protein